MKKQTTIEFTNESTKKTGYLNREIEFFYLKDSHLSEIDFHYHEFHKILILLGGSLDYQIEGKTYSLKENDIILVPAKTLHRPILKPCDYYERLIVYVSDDFLISHSDTSLLLSDILSQATKLQNFLVRPALYTASKIEHIVAELIEEMVTNSIGHTINRNLLFLQLMVALNRIELKETPNNDKISEIISYINSHLTEDLSIDILAEKLYISRFYLMHTFKEKTGYTLGNFISTKRLILAHELIEAGTPVTEACFSCGYNSYSAFFRAYKKLFGSDNHKTFREL